MTSLTDIKQFVLDFRSACDKVDWLNMPSEYESFPRGTCGAMSEILASYLIAEGYTNVEYVAGTKGEKSHAWLEIEGMAIDVTASQFDEFESQSLFQKSSKCHKGFREQQRFPCSGNLSGNQHFVSSAIHDQLEI